MDAYEKRPTVYVLGNSDSDPTGVVREFLPPVSRTRGGCLLRVWDYFREFCGSTSLHGLKYVGEPEKPHAQRWAWPPFVGRVCWVLTFLLSLSVCCVFIWQAKHKWDTTPVIVTFAESSYPVSKLPFPAVTMCGEAKINHVLFSYQQMYERRDNITEEQMKQIQYAALVCDEDVEVQANDTTDDSAIDFLLEVAPSLWDTVRRCRWQSKDISCGELFDTIITDEGVCYTFNGIEYEDFFTENAYRNSSARRSRSRAVRRWSVDDGYVTGNDEGSDEAGDDEAVYPRRTSAAGAMAGLDFILTTDEQDVDASCRWPVQGFKMLLHNPVAFPDMSSQFFRVPVDRDLVVTVRPAVMMTSESLVDYPPERRRCYFTRERSLYFFRYYSEENCRAECLVNYTVRECGCSAYYMPREKEVPICGGSKMPCVKEAQSRFYGDTKNLTACQCLPGCVEINYNIETSQSQILWRKYLDFNPDAMQYFQNFTFGRVVIYYQNSQFIPSFRTELYGFTSFLANCGGLLGLFLGFSVLSLVECLYFLTARAYLHFR
ncbi:pickpocket protein 28-like [Schistocerca americana]|uniref:pickpocket protein 28-like n=1 Tax=Schistocerca americana TaxID=7009 RepID=UPI001F4F22F2|nr:pickpocket protein 28-like [Schistocerca americana]